MFLKQGSGLEPFISMSPDSDSDLDSDSKSDYQSTFEIPWKGTNSELRTI